MSQTDNLQCKRIATELVKCFGGFVVQILSGNSNSELGRGNRRDDWRPQPLPDIENTSVTQVACGGYHSAALTDDGAMLTSATEDMGSSGTGSLQNGKVPTVVEALGNKRVVWISCESSWTAAVTEAGELYTWGKNRDYQLGVRSLRDTQMTSVLVSFDEEDGGGRNPRASIPRVVCVSAGATHGMALFLT